MLQYEFHRAFANTPLPDREIVIGGRERPITLSIIYKGVRDLEDFLAPHIARMESLIKLADASGLLYKEKK